MFRFLMVCLILIGIGACASTSPEAPEASTASGANASANSGSITAENPAAQEDGVLALDASELPQTASNEPDYDPNEIVCVRERQTGSKFTTKTCRTRAEIEARKERDQEIMESMNRRQSGGCGAFSPDC